jgi:hypothetical protein
MRRRLRCFLPSSARRRRAKKRERGMFRKAAIVLALTLAVGSLSAARAEDPDQEFVAGYQASVPPLREAHQNAAVNEPKKSFWCLGC